MSYAVSSENGDWGEHDTLRGAIQDITNRVSRNDSNIELFKKLDFVVEQKVSVRVKNNAR